MSRPCAITVSRSKRGTTVKATGKAAQALFDAMAARLVAEIDLRRSDPHSEGRGQPADAGPAPARRVAP